MKISAKTFLTLNILLFVVLTVCGIRVLPTLPAVLLATMVAAMPYMLLRVRMEGLRRKGSLEGERVTAALLNQYRIANYNMYEAIERLVASGDDYKICKNLLFKLLLEIRGTGSMERIRVATERFAAALNTNWGRMLANNIRLSVEDGMNVSLGMEDILIQLREARAISEERKRLNGESVRIVTFLIPLIYVGSVFLAVNFLDMPLAAFFRNQFATPEGFTLLMGGVFLFFVNVLGIELVMNQKMDF